MTVCPALVAASLLLAGDPDWLIDPAPYRARVEVTEGRQVTLDNGLIRRTINLAPNAATTAYDNLITGAALLRSVRPEALVTVDGTQYAVGGLEGQPVHNYFSPDWLPQMRAVPGAYEFDHLETGVTTERFPWRKRAEWMPSDLPWPPPGRSLTLHFRPPAAAGAAARGDLPWVQVHYEIYDGIPLLCKWLTLTNPGPKAVRLNTLTTEVLAAVEPESAVGRPIAWMDPRPDIYIESDYAMAGDGNPRPANRVAHWEADPLYATQEIGRASCRERV